MATAQRLDVSLQGLIPDQSEFLRGITRDFAPDLDFLAFSDHCQLPVTGDRIDSAGCQCQSQNKQGEAFHVEARSEVEVARAKQSYETHGNKIDGDDFGQQAREHENENAGDE